MIDKIQKPHCYSAFYSSKIQPNTSSHSKKQDTSTAFNVITYAASLACAALATYGIAKTQSKALNKKINIFNVKYSEKDMLKVAFSALAGGTATGIVLDDKKYVKPKLHEALNQAISNIVFPLLFVFGLNKGYDKISKNVKIFQFKETSSLKKGLNVALKVLPNFVVACGGIIAGVIAGTKVSNFINKKIDKDFVDRKTKLLDFCYHPDDLAAAIILADKHGCIQKTVGRIIPPVFALHGFEAGTKRTNKE